MKLNSKHCYLIFKNPIKNLFVAKNKTGIDLCFYCDNLYFN